MGNRTRTMRRMAEVAFALALSSSTSRVWAAAAETSAPVELLQDAERFMAEGKVASACPKFAESNRLEPRLGVLLQLADCYERLGKTASAWASFNELAALAGRAQDDRLAIAKRRLAELEPRLSRLTVAIPAATVVAELEIHCNGVPLGRALWGTALPVDAGQYTVTFSAPGKVRSIRRVRFWTEGVSQTITAPELEDLKARGSAIHAQQRRRPESARTRGALGWMSLGISAAMIGMGVTFSVELETRLAERARICPSSRGCSREDARRIDALTDQARGASTALILAFTLGGALATAGAVLIYTAPDDAGALRAAPWIGRRVAGLSVAHGF